MSKLSGHGQSVAKAISWRVLGSIDTFGLGFLITGNVAAASAIASTEVFTKFVLYYLHERAWISLPALIRSRVGAARNV